MKSKKKNEKRISPKWNWHWMDSLLEKTRDIEKKRKRAVLQDRIVDSSNLTESLKQFAKVNARDDSAEGNYTLAFDFFQWLLARTESRVSPRVLISKDNKPYVVIDQWGEPWEFDDPNLPEELMPLAKNYWESTNPDKKWPLSRKIN